MYVLLRITLKHCGRIQRSVEKYGKIVENTMHTHILLVIV